jgi:hypothetical protein
MRTILLFALLGQSKTIEPERVNIEDEKFRSHALIAFASSAAELQKRVEAHWKKEEKKLPALKAGEIHYYLLWGWSGSGLDASRRTKVEAEYLEKEKCLKITVTRAQYKDTGGFGGTADMQYVGFALPLGKLAAGEYSVKIHEIIETYKDPGDENPKKSDKKLVQEQTFKLQ